jgi:HK97 family phage prohead protease
MQTDAAMPRPRRDGFLYSTCPRGDGTFYINRMSRYARQKLLEMGPLRFFYECGDSPKHGWPADVQRVTIDALGFAYAQLSGTLLTRDIGSDLEFRDALVRPRTFNATARTVQVVAATATPVDRGGFDEILDPNGADLGPLLRGAPVLNGHRTQGVDNIIGTVIDARVENGELIATVQLSERPELQSIVRDIEAGIIRNVSVGYQVTRWQDGTANGRRTRTAVQWTPREISFVAVGADPNARTRSHTSAREIFNLVERLRMPTGIAVDLIERGASLDQARNALLDHMVDRGMHIRASIATDYTAPDMQNRAIADALYARMTGTAPSGQARELGHRSAIGLMEYFAEVNGVPLRSRDPSEVYHAVMTRAAPGLHTTSDFPLLLADTMGRRLGELFRILQSGAAAIVTTGTANDFRPITEGRTSSFPSLEPVNEDGEIKWGTIDEEGETLAIASYARAIGVTFKVIVNDDLSAIDRAIRDTAFATAQLKMRLIVAALSAKLRDGKALFHADHKNLAPTGAAPDETTLSEGRIAMMRQSPPGSTEPLGLSPSILLVPAELQTLAEKLVASITPPTVQDVNVFAGRLQVAVEPRLPTDSEWYLFASPTVYPLIRFLTLAGYESPRFETSQEFSRLGTAYRVHWHVGAGPIDWRGAWKNPGE